MAIDINRSELDITTVEGRKAARQRLAESAKSYIIKEFDDLFSAKITDSETPAQRVETLGNLLGELDTIDAALERTTPSVIAWEDIEVKEREWLIPGWLPANTATLFTGDGGAGKSWLTLQVICQIACGFTQGCLDPDYEVPKPAEYDDSLPDPKHIVFATYEDEPAEIKRRLQALASSMCWIKEKMETIKKYLHIVDMRSVGSVWGPGVGNHIANTGALLYAGEAIRDICKERQANLLVMDPLSGAFGGNENDRTAVYDFVSSFRGWCDESKCALLAIGHLPKGAEGRAAGFSGSTAWEAAARCMWKLSKKNEGKDKEYWVLEHTKSNYARLQAEIPLIKTKWGCWKEAASVEKAVEGWQTYQQEIDDENNT